jgi:hypothetical protein
MGVIWHNGKKASSFHPHGSGNSRRHGNSANGYDKQRTANSAPSNNGKSYSQVAQQKDAAKKHKLEMSELSAMVKSLALQQQQQSHMMDTE